MPVLLAAAALAGCAGLPSQGAKGPPSPEASATAAKAMAPQDQAQLYLDVVEGLIRQQRYGAAIAFLDAAKAKDFGARYWLLRGNALLGLERTDEALAAYAALDKTALAAEGWNGKGRVAAARRQWPGAFTNFREAVREEPSNPDFLNNLAFAGLHLEQSGASAAYLRQAWELKPDSSLIRNNLIIALTLAGDHDGADAILNGLKDRGEREKVEAIVGDALKDKAFAGDGAP